MKQMFLAFIGYLRRYRYFCTWPVVIIITRIKSIFLGRYFSAGSTNLVSAEKHFVVGEGGVQSPLFCIFNHCYFISSPNKLKICHTMKQLYIHNIMPKHENNAFQKKFYNQFKKGTFFVECAPCMGHTRHEHGVHLIRQ